MTRRALLIAVLGAACGREPRPAAIDTAVVATVAPTDSALVPTDSLIATTRSGMQIWLTEGRSSRDAAGKPCYERGIEIRTDSSRLRVPLLYTGAVPVLTGSRTLEAELWRDCKPMAIYRVDLASGRPTKVRDR